MKGFQKPQVGFKRFNCPHCYAFSDQRWLISHLTKPDKLPDYGGLDAVRDTLMEQGIEINEDEQFNRYSKPYLRDWTTKTTYAKLEYVFFSQCASCDDVSIWVHNRLFYPNTKFEVQPNPDMPPDVAADFREAAEILSASPRAAAALLRLAVQKLLINLDLPGKNINDDIGTLVKRGLPVRVQQALDIVRVVGNNAVHPGTISVDDSLEIASQLFSLLNIITEQMITQPRAIDELFNNLPDGARKSILKRDN